MKMLSVEAEVFHADGQTDGQTDGNMVGQMEGKREMIKLVVAFCNFSHTPKKWPKEICVQIVAFIDNVNL